MKTAQVLSRLEKCSGQIVISKEEAKTILGQVNFLETVVARLLTSMRKRKKEIDVQIPYRQSV